MSVSISRTSGVSYYIVVLVSLLSFVHLFSIDGKLNCETLPDTSGQQLFYSNEELDLEECPIFFILF